MLKKGQNAGTQFVTQNDRVKPSCAVSSTNPTLCQYMISLNPKLEGNMLAARKICLKREIERI